MYIFEKFTKIFRNFSDSYKSGNEKYNANVEGDWVKFDLSNSDYFIGSLPDAQFVIESVRSCRIKIDVKIENKVKHFERK